MIAYQCLFGGNYLRDTEALYSIYWTIMRQDNDNVTYVDDNSDEMGFIVTKPSQYCHGDNYTCCRFVSYLQVDTSVISGRTVMTCNAIYREDNSVSNPTSLSEFICTILFCAYTALCIYQTVREYCLSKDWGDYSTHHQNSVSKKSS